MVPGEPLASLEDVGRSPAVLQPEVLAMPRLDFIDATLSGPNRLLLLAVVPELLRDPVAPEDLLVPPQALVILEPLSEGLVPVSQERRSRPRTRTGAATG